MKSRKKVIIINGSSIERLFYKTDPLKCLVAQENLEKFSNVINVGKPDVGFDFHNLETELAEHINPEDKQINVILKAHGGFNKESYCITTSARYKESKIVADKIKKIVSNNGDINQQMLKDYEMQINLETEVIEAKDLIEKLVKIVGNRSLKIFALCCYGENLLDFTNLLPAGSYIITLSNKDTVTSSSVLFNEDSEAILSHLFCSEFKMEYLIEAFLLSQKDQQNTPKIGIKTIGGKSLIINMLDYARNLDLTSNQLNFSEIFNKHLLKHGIDASYIIDKLRTIQREDNIDSYKISDEGYKKIIDFRYPLSFSGTSDDIVEFIARYYPFFPVEEIKRSISHSKKDELALSSFKKYNLTPLSALKIMESFDFNTHSNPKVDYMPMTLYDLVLAAASDIMVSKDDINYIMNDVAPALVGDASSNEEPS